MSFLTVPELLTRVAMRTPDAPYLRWSDRGHTLTFAELDRLSAKAAGALKAFGVEKGDRVGLLAHNGHDYFVAMFAT